MKSKNFGNAGLMLLLLWALVGAPGRVSAQPDARGRGGAARGLLERIVGDRADAFRLEVIPQENGRDVYEIESVGDTVVLRGSNGVALASALNAYLKQHCHACVSLCGKQLDLPDPMPKVEEKVRCVTPFTYRYCFNYCCFSYSMAWFDWADWERVIDWMALHGVNMPLAATGQEAVWQTVYQELGLSDQEIGEFMVGPAYLPFGWMGCMDGWGGPLTQDWIDRHDALEKRILERERALGMTPVLQGFTGHVPAALKKRFPDAEFQQLPSWCGFPGTLFVDPRDPLFRRIGKAFVEEQTRRYGTDHLYASDTFIEMSPPSDEPAFLEAMARAVHGAMAAADPEARWVMQGWLFVNNPGFWKPPQAKALLRAVPDDRMLVLDLFCEAQPAWTRTEAFYGKPWLWCVIQSFGNQVSLHGGLPQIAEGLSKANADPQRGKLTGVGFIMEGLGYNPVVYDLLNDMMWHPGATELDDWIADYATRRYGRAHPKAIEAWRGLLDTVYRVPGQVGSDICARPKLGAAASWIGRQRPYHDVKLARAAQCLLECAEEFGAVDTYRYDVVHVLRQVLTDLVPGMKFDIAAAYEAQDRARLQAAGTRFLELMRDLDELLGTREEFLLGRWLESAKRWAANDEERRHYEWNARNQITLWGGKDSVLHDYASKQWAGLIRGFYLPRWRQFLEGLDEALEAGRAFDNEAFEQRIRDWEEAWTHGTDPRVRGGYADTPKGDAVDVARRLWAKYHERIFAVEAPSLTTGKPVTCSAALEPYPAEYANDGRRYNTDQYWAVDLAMDPDGWWQVDLEEPTEVGRVVVVLYFGDERSYEFTVETSLDGAAWECVADYRGKPQRSTPDGVTCRFESRAVRFIRVTVTNNSANTGRHLVEVMAYP